MPDIDNKNDKNLLQMHTLYYSPVLAGHSSVHVSPRNQSLRVSDDVSSKSTSSHVRGCTWYHNSRNVLAVMCIKILTNLSKYKKTQKSPQMTANNYAH